MFWDADIAKTNVLRYERKLDKIEWKQILCCINNFSKYGYTGLRWNGHIRIANLKMLEDYGYTVIKITHCIYEISWINQ